MNKTLYESPVLVAETKLEGEKFWRVRAYTNAEGTFTETEAWRGTKQGESKHVISAPTRIEGKNIGRANETTPEQQAIAEAKAEEVKKRERKGYWTLGEEKPTGVYRAMKALSGTWEDNGHNITYPAAVQPKYDGHRLTFDGVTGWSKEGNLVVPECIQHLRFDTGGLVLDGEIMLPHGEFLFEDGTSAAKKYDPVLSPKLVFYVFDIVDEELPFQARHDKLRDAAKNFPAGIRLAPTRTVQSADEVMEAFGEFREEGHEGAFVWNLVGPTARYLQNHRSSGLVKVKGMNVSDDEFIVVSAEEGTGKFVGMPVFRLKSKSGVDVGKATPKGTFPEKRAYWTKRHEIIGQTVTVQYQGYTKDGKLRFGVVLRVREDL